MDGIDNCIKNLLINKKSKEKYFVAWLSLRWSQLCGGQFAQKSSPVNIKDGTLFVDAANSNWSHALLMKKDELINEINAQLYSQVNKIIIKDIKLNIRKISYNDLVNETAKIKDIDEKLPALTEQEIQMIQMSLQDIEDVRLKSKLSSILTAVKRKSIYTGQMKTTAKDGLSQPDTDERRQKILYDLFYHMPWLSHKDMPPELNVGEEEYWRARQRCEAIFSDKALRQSASSADIMMYVMIKTSCGVEQLTDELIRAVMLQTTKEREKDNI